VPTTDEANAPQIHKLEDEAAETNSTNMSFVARMLHNQEDTRKRRRVTAQYHSIAHVSPTSNICERLFSRAKLVMRPHRRHIDPSTLEMILLSLRMNKDLWDAVSIEKLI